MKSAMGLVAGKAVIFIIRDCHLSSIGATLQNVFPNTITKQGERAMSISSNLQLAADAIEDAKKRLNRAKDDVDDDYEIRQAMKILDEAAAYIKTATSELPK
jgi:hypothetical protein